MDAHEKVTGAAAYPDDLTMQGMLYARVLRSPHPHAVVRHMDLDAARALPGVIAAVTGDDITGLGVFGVVTPDQPALARTGGKVRYVGDAVAAVAAETAQAAEAALDLIDVEYELLPVVSDARSALDPSAPLVHDALKTNMLHSVGVRHGDVAAGFAAADVIVEGHYTTPFVDHAYLQPEGGLALMGEDGRVTVWVATQWADEDRRQIASALGLPMQQVREIVTATGGGFGGREDISVQIVLALLAIETGRPVKMIYSREESLVASTKRHPFDMVYRTGARRDGRLTAMEIELIANAGAYESTSRGVLNTAVTLATGPYEVPNVSLDAKAMYTNNPPTAAMRGFGANQPNYAAEMQMSKLATALGIEPGELRRRNLQRKGSITLTGQLLGEGVGAIQALDAAEAQASDLGLRHDYPRHQGSKRRGVGIACGFTKIGFNLGWDDWAAAEVEAYPDHAVVKAGACDVGQGSTTVLAQLAASKLELPLSAIQVITSDTDRVPDAGSSSASRHTFVTGNAVLGAASEAALRLAELGAEPPPGSLPVVAKAVYHAPTTFPLDPATGQSPRASISHGYGCHVVEVEIDVRTGETQLLQVVAAHDVGQAINLSSVEGQIEGGCVMGQGYALLEEYVLDAGQPKTTNLATFTLPTFLDAPARIIPVVVQVPDPEGPYGAKGLGEMTMIPTPGAIAAAIHDAVGVWIDDLPMTPERILAALAAKEVDAPATVNVPAGPDMTDLRYEGTHDMAAI